MTNIGDNVDAALITNDISRRYLTGMKSSAGLVLVTREESYLLIDFRYYETARREVNDFEVIMLTDATKQLNDLIHKHDVKCIAIEGQNMSVSELSLYQERFPSIVFESDKLSKALMKMRSIKTDEEIAKIEKAQRIAERAFSHILDYIRVGITEKDVALELDYFMLRNGAHALSFDTIAVSGGNGSSPHGVPTDKNLSSGELLTMDFGAVVDGYHSDMTRTIAIGEIPQKAEEAYYTVLDAQNKAIQNAFAGLTGRELDKIARDHIESKGYGSYFGHALGHGVGMEIHEEPRVSPKSQTKLCENMIITVEPGIYISREFGIRIEDMIVIGKDSNINLTNSPKNLIKV